MLLNYFLEDKVATQNLNDSQAAQFLSKRFEYSIKLHSNVLSTKVDLAYRDFQRIDRPPFCESPLKYNNAYLFLIGYLETNLDGWDET